MMPLAAEVQGRLFNSGEEAALTRFLDETEENTLTHPIEDPNQVLLDHNCRTVDGQYQFTWLAVRQVSRVLGAGLGTYLTDLAGYRRAPSADDREFYSDEDAAAVFNMAVRRRFRQELLGFQAIRNASTGTIDAVVGHGYRRLPNRDFLERVREVLGAVDRPVEFHEALVVGRRVTVRYRFVEPIYEGDDRLLTVHGGFSFANSEVGDGAVRGTPLLWFNPSGTALMPYNAGCRVAHTGKDFPRRMQRLLDRTLDRWRLSELSESIGRYVEELESANLGFGGVDEDADDGRFRELVSHLRHRHLTQSTARRVLRRAVFSGGRVEAPIDLMRSERRRTWGGRTALDVFVAVLRESEATLLNVTVRERLEQLAYQMLAGRFRL
jgi:hypothetical protein